MTRLRQRMLEELQRRNYTQATIDAYIFAVQEFSSFSGGLRKDWEPSICVATNCICCRRNGCRRPPLKFAFPRYVFCTRGFSGAPISLTTICHFLKPATHCPPCSVPKR